MPFLGPKMRSFTAPEEVFLTGNLEALTPPWNLFLGVMMNVVANHISHPNRALIILSKAVFLSLRRRSLSLNKAMKLQPIYSEMDTKDSHNTKQQHTTCMRLPLGYKRSTSSIKIQFLYSKMAQSRRFWVQFLGCL